MDVVDLSLSIEDSTGNGIHTSTDARRWERPGLDGTKEGIFSKNFH